MSFEQYDLSPDLLNGLVDTRIEKPTPLQQEVIPQALEGKHLLIKNENEDNGAFLIPVLQKLIANGEAQGTRILILTPSVERAKAIDELIWAMGYHAQISSASLSMKGDKSDQEQAVLDGAPVIVANPRRLVDILEKTKVTFKDLESVVIDEAHNMENFSLVGRIKSILGFIENQPQVLIFSGTMNNATKQLAKDALNNPELIGFQEGDLESKASEAIEINEEVVREKLQKASVKVVLNSESSENMFDDEKTRSQQTDDDKPVEDSNADLEAVKAKLEKASVKVVLNPEKEDEEAPSFIPQGLEHAYINVPLRMKISTLMAHLENSQVKRIVIFTASKRTSDRLFKIILKKNWGVVSVHENLDESIYNERLQKFTSNEMKILVVGGISAKEIELDEITQVINYDVPSDIDEYRYRAELVDSGRAAQMISLVSTMDREDIKRITEEAGYAPEEITLPEEIKEKKQRKAPDKNKNHSHRGSNKSQKHKNSKHKRKPSGKSSTTNGLPRPSYDGLSGGREGSRSGSVFGWMKKLFD